MSERSTIIEKPARLIPNSTEWVRPKFGMHWLEGNRRPYFSLTADVLYGQRGGISACGCCHDSIVAAFPELAELVPWHLCDDTGEPMHYVANGVYWGQLEMGISRWKETAVPHGYDSFMGVLKSHCLVDALGDWDRFYREFVGWSMGHFNDAPQSAQMDFEKFLRGRIPAMKAKFDEVMARHGVKMIEVPTV